jgi:hypothetical protein
VEEFIHHIRNFNWFDLVTLVIGGVFGAIISVAYSIRSNRPKLLIAGGGSGSNQTSANWRIAIANQPSFFGQRLDGETAYDVHPWLREDQPKSQFYPVRWVGQSDNRIIIEPGLGKDIELFHWDKGDSSYYIKDQAGEPVARFSDRELGFVLRLNDRLGRQTEFRFKVSFDATHLKQNPRLSIVHPKTFGQRWDAIRGGAREVFSAFKNN